MNDERYKIKGESMINSEKYDINDEKFETNVTIPNDASMWLYGYIVYEKYDDMYNLKAKLDTICEKENKQCEIRPYEFNRDYAFYQISILFGRCRCRFRWALGLYSACNDFELRRSTLPPTRHDDYDEYDDSTPCFDVVTPCNNYYETL